LTINRVPGTSGIIVFLRSIVTTIWLQTAPAGGLGTANYQWDELMQYDDTPGLKGLCPPGWHVPTEAEWNTLFANYINNGFAGIPLKY
jgi:Fibrobacter succinogenes major domain (Fib_succ_major)